MSPQKLLLLALELIFFFFFEVDGWSVLHDSMLSLVFWLEAGSHNASAQSGLGFTHDKFSKT